MPSFVGRSLAPLCSPSRAVAAGAWSGARLGSRANQLRCCCNSWPDFEGLPAPIAYLPIHPPACLRRPSYLPADRRLQEGDASLLLSLDASVSSVGPDLLALTGTTGDAVWSAPGDPADSLNLHSAGKAATLLPCSAALPCCPHKPTTTTTTPQPPQTAAALL